MEIGRTGTGYPDIRLNLGRNRLKYRKTTHINQILPGRINNKRPQFRKLPQTMLTLKCYLSPTYFYLKGIVHQIFFLDSRLPPMFILRIWSAFLFWIPGLELWPLLCAKCTVFFHFMYTLCAHSSDHDFGLEPSKQSRFGSFLWT